MGLSSPNVHMERVLRDLGIDLLDENFLDTPMRFCKYLQHYTQPYDPQSDLSTGFDLKDKVSVYDRAMVVQANIPYRAICAHHLVPVLGTAHIGYIPKTRVVGLSKLSRLLYGISHNSPSLQEDVCNGVVECLMEYLEPAGAMCVITAEHGCMAARGVEDSGIQTVTSSIRGVFVEHHDARSEFYKLVRCAS